MPCRALEEHPPGHKPLPQVLPHHQSVCLEMLCLVAVWEHPLPCPVTTTDF